MAENKTTIEEPDQKDKAKVKPPAKNKKKGNSPAYTPSEIEKMLDTILKLVAKLTGRVYEYSPKDFQQEAAGLVRLSEKYSIIATAISMFDPITVLSGLINKFINMKRTPEAVAKKEKKTVRPPNEAGGQQ